MDEVEVYSWRRDEIADRYRQIRANCAEWKASIPPPPEAFQRRVEELLAEARSRALISMPNPVVVHLRTGSRWGARQAQTVRRAIGRRCAGCGCAHDDTTYGCANCCSRHAMRRRAREARAA